MALLADGGSAGGQLGQAEHDELAGLTTASRSHRSAGRPRCLARVGLVVALDVEAWSTVSPNNPPSSHTRYRNERMERISRSHRSLSFGSKPPTGCRPAARTRRSCRAAHVDVAPRGSLDRVRAPRPGCRGRGRPHAVDADRIEQVVLGAGDRRATPITPRTTSLAGPCAPREWHRCGPTRGMCPMAGRASWRLGRIEYFSHGSRARRTSSRSRRS